MPRRISGALMMALSTTVALCGLSHAAWAEDVIPSHTIQAEVVDPSAYLKDGSHGATQTDQTYQAVDSGQTLALLEEPAGNLYLLLAENPGDDPNALVYDYVNQQVKATGRVYAKGGVQGIVLTAVDPLEAPEAATGAPAANPPVDN